MENKRTMARGRVVTQLTLGPRSRRKDKNKMNLAETRYNDVEWIHLAQEMDE